MGDGTAVNRFHYSPGNNLGYDIAIGSVCYISEVSSALYYTCGVTKLVIIKDD